MSILSARRGGYALYQSEAREEKIHPSVVSTVRTVWKIFVGYTLLSVVVLFVAIRASDTARALPLWEVAWQALNHAMTGLSTGGFAVTDNSIARTTRRSSRPPVAIMILGRLRPRSTTSASRHRRDLLRRTTRSA